MLLRPSKGFETRRRDCGDDKAQNDIVLSLSLWALFLDISGGTGFMAGLIGGCEPLDGLRYCINQRRRFVQESHGTHELNQIKFQDPDFCRVRSRTWVNHCKCEPHVQFPGLPER